MVHEILDQTKDENLVGKIQACTNALQHWGNKIRPKFRSDILKYRLQLEESRQQNGSNGDLQFDAIRDRFITLLVQEEMYWSQRAKTHWLKEGDQNTSFFSRYWGYLWAYYF